MVHYRLFYSFSWAWRYCSCGIKFCAWLRQINHRIYGKNPILCIILSAQARAQTICWVLFTQRLRMLGNRDCRGKFRLTQLFQIVRQIAQDLSRVKSKSHRTYFRRKNNAMSYHPYNISTWRMWSVLSHMNRLTQHFNIVEIEWWMQTKCRCACMLESSTSKPEQDVSRTKAKR